jgi:hypothetical protein
MVVSIVQASRSAVSSSTFSSSKNSLSKVCRPRICRASCRLGQFHGTVRLLHHVAELFQLRIALITEGI